MKNFRYAILFLSVLLLAYSCEKEYSYEGSALATGSLRASTGECLGNIVNGNYRAGITMNGSNSVSVSVDIYSPGYYTIYTDTVNGYFFKTAGFFTTSGIHNVELTGSGTPLVEGVDDFTVHFNNSTCGLSVIVLPLTIPPGSGAVYTFNCTGAIVAGIYKVDLPLNSSNTVEIQANVQTIGDYSISTIPVNGMTFSATGSFSNTGIQTIILTGSGTPVVAQTNNINVGSGSNQCSFSLNVEPVTPGPAQFILMSTAGVCAAFVNGTYTVNTALVYDNRINFQVNVITPGIIQLSTYSVNGMSFSNITPTLTISTPGIWMIVLYGNGSPTTAGNNMITITAGNQSCNCNVQVNP